MFACIISNAENKYITLRLTLLLSIGNIYIYINTKVNA